MNHENRREGIIERELRDWSPEQPEALRALLLAVYEAAFEAGFCEGCDRGFELAADPSNKVEVEADAELMDLLFSR